MHIYEPGCIPVAREEIVFIDHNETNGTINALRLGKSSQLHYHDHINHPLHHHHNHYHLHHPKRIENTIHCKHSRNPAGAYKAHWVTEGNVMSYSKDIACIDVQRRSS